MFWKKRLSDDLPLASRDLQQEFDGGQWIPHDALPTPEQVAALDVLGYLVVDERVPNWAARWLAGGFDGVALRELASLSGTDSREVRDTLPQALIDAGASGCSQHEAAEMMLNAVAARYLDGFVHPLYVANALNALNLQLDDINEAMAAFPLFSVYLIEEDWENERSNRSQSEMAQEIRSACLKQLGRKSRHLLSATNTSKDVGNTASVESIRPA